MMTYKDWQMLQESSFTLGLRSPKALGITGSKLSEMGFPPAGPEADDDNQDPAIDDMGAEEPAPSPMGMDTDGGNKIVIDMDKLGPLLQALGIDISGPTPDLGGGDADAQVGSEDGVDFDAMFGGGGEEGAPADDAGPAGPTVGGKAPFPADDSEEDTDDEATPPFAKGGSDDSEEDTDDEVEDDSEDSAPPFAKGDSEDDDSDDEVEDDDTEEDKPSPKFMHKGKKKEFMCGKCGNITKEEASIFDSIIKNGRGNHKQKNSGGVGFAPQGRIGGMR